MLFQEIFMRRKLTSLILLLSIMSSSLAVAVTSPTNDEKENIVDRIVRESQGNVEINIPDNILTLIMTPPAGNKRQQSDQALRPGINKMDGFRIQVFSDGRNQSSLEARAKARGSAILAKFPKFRGQIYTFSSSPNWYTRVGNFRSQAEAAKALAELKRAFPAFASEMRVVKCKIVVVK